MKLKSGYTFQAYAGIRASSSQDTPSGSDPIPHRTRVTGPTPNKNPTIELHRESNLAVPDKHVKTATFEFQQIKPLHQFNCSDLKITEPSLELPPRAEMGKHDSI